MEIYSLSNRIYTTWGVQYHNFIWDPNWKIFINLADKEIQNGWIKPNSIRYIICWFDRNILQRLGKDSIATLKVRIRVVCGLVNKLPYTKLPRDLKITFMECIWHAFHEFYSKWKEWHCKYILRLPF